jgi:hypothetical protein
MQARGRDENIARETVPGSPEAVALLERGGLRDFGERRNEQQILAGAIESLEQSL